MRTSPALARPLGLAALITLALPLGAQRFDTVVKNVVRPVHPGVGRLVPELTIGGADATAEEYLFASIGNLFAAADGTLWVIDGRYFIGKPTIRRYDRSGTFIGNVGRRGDGPGEWQAPEMLAQLRDGRVILRDAVVGRPLTFYKPNGDYDTAWAYQTSTVHSVRVDTSDAIWLWMQAGLALRSTSPIVMVRRRMDGTLIDTVPEPPPFPPPTRSSFTVSANERRPRSAHRTSRAASGRGARTGTTHVE